MDNVTEKNAHRDGCVGQATTSSRGESLGLILDRLLRSLENLGDGFGGEHKRAAEVRERLIEERFHLAVLGQFKRGKSTLMNALLGEMLLPTSVVPVTSIPTFLRWGPRRLVRVVFLDGKSLEFPDLSLERAAQILSDYVTEGQNPRNKLGVASVEVEHPSSLLRQGVVLIDTPGIGSTFRHNTEATLNFLPQCDAALFVVSADPPITEVEVEFLKAVRGKVARLFFVLNKVDYLTEEERHAAVSFLRKVIHEQAGFDTKEPVFSISARQGLQAKLDEDDNLWEESGFKDLQAYLLDFLARDKARTLQSALARKSIDVVASVIMRIRLEHRSLQMPLHDLEECIQVFGEKIREVERERVTTMDLLAGDRKRTVEFLEDLAERLRNDARGCFKRIISESLENGAGLGLVEQQAKAQLEEQIPVFFEAELAPFSDAVERRLREALRPYQERLDTLIDTLRRTAAHLFDIPYHAPNTSGDLERLHNPYWVTQRWSTSISLVPEGFFDRFLPLHVRKRRIEKRLSEELRALVVHNVENIRWATLRNLDDTFRSFSSTVNERLEETVEATRGAIRAAHVRRREGAETVQPELQRLDQKAAELTGVEHSLIRFTASISAKETNTCV